MTTLKPTTKKAEDIINRYYNVAMSNLSEAYNKPSDSKRKVFRHILEIMEDMKGYRFRILSYNLFTFTCGFTYDDENGNLRLRYFTRDNIYDMALPSPSVFYSQQYL